MQFQRLFAALVAISAAAQQQPQAPLIPDGGVARFSTSSNLVIVDVTVKDKSGKVLNNLKSSDFTVTEDGKPQKLVVFEFEQLAAEPRCWTARPDGLVDPSLNRFNFTGICNRYIDSNGYSLRVGEQDLATTHRLRLVQVGQELRLLASSETMPVELLVGRGPVPLRVRDGFVELRLEPGWSLQRRTYLGRSLSHLYVANGDTLPALVARARFQPGQAPAGLADPPMTAFRPGRSRTQGLSGPSLAGLPESSGAPVPGQPIPLQVIPFRE